MSSKILRSGVYTINLFTEHLTHFYHEKKKSTPHSLLLLSASVSCDSPPACVGDA